MIAAHISTSGMHCRACPPLIESELRLVPGVERVIARRDLALTSVTYDEKLVNIDVLQQRLRNRGFTTEVLVQSPLS